MLLAAAAHEGALGEVRHARVQWTYKANDTSNWRAKEDVGREGLRNVEILEQIA
jgi:hypothetical protein